MGVSVVDALTSAGLYKSSGRIQEEMLKTITPTGEMREHKMAEIDYFDLKILGDELDIALRLQNEYIQSLYAKYAVAIVNLVRVINDESASGFKGSNGAGRQLDILLLRAEQFGDPDQADSSNRRASWIRAIGAPVSNQFVVAEDALGANAHGALAMGTTEGLAIFGFANPAAAPCVDALQATYLAQAYNIQNADFELANPFVGDAIIELKQPFIIYPQESGLLATRYYRAGQDEMRPIGVWVKMSQNLRTLATS